MSAILFVFTDRQKHVTSTQAYRKEEAKKWRRIIISSVDQRSYTTCWCETGLSQNRQTARAVADFPGMSIFGPINT